MKKICSAVAIPLFVVSFYCVSTQAQSLDSLSNELRKHGNVWGLTFGDFVFKGVADDAGASGLGRGNNQYSKIPADAHYFQYRRIFLGYNYDISSKFTAEILLAAEDDYSPGSIGNQSLNGDALTDGKFSPYLRLANIHWKEIFKGSELIIGTMPTPAFPQLTETLWGYRSIEKTVADLHKTLSYDKGVALQGKFDKNANYGYDFMIGTGNGAKPESDNFQMFYGDVWAKFLHKKLIVDLYQDYGKLDWTNIDTLSNKFHHDRNTTKIMVAYTVPKYTVGIEAMRTVLMGDVEAPTRSGRTYYLTTVATAVSMYARGRLYKDKWGFFARYDIFNPGHNVNAIIDNPKIIAYTALTPNYDPTIKEQFVSFGVDYTPVPNVHFMPNFYLNTYTCTYGSEHYDLNPSANDVKGTDAVYRLTVYYIFGKKDPVRY